MQIIQLKEIKLSNIVLNISKDKVVNLNEDIQDLVISIRKLGLLQPLTLYKNTNENYIVLLGRRRFLAIQKLGWETTMAIVARPVSDLDGKMIWLSENLVRRAIPNKDAIDILTDSYNKCGSIKAIADNTGLRDVMIRKYVKFVRLPKNVQEAIRNGRITLNNGLKAADTLKWDSDQVDQTEKVLKLAFKLEGTNHSNKKIERIGKSDKFKQAILMDFA